MGRCGALVGVGLLLALGAAACGNRAIGTGQSSRDGGPQIDLADDACFRLGAFQCQQDGRCELLGCPDCSGTITSGRCVAKGQGGDVACPAIACLKCSNLDEVTCRATLGCAAATCTDCDGVRSFGGCHDASERPPSCAGGACPRRCSMLVDEASCLANPGCVADHCPGCSCTADFVACRDPEEPPTACPPIGCEPPDCCSGLSEIACLSTIDCNPMYCRAPCQGPVTYIGCLPSFGPPPLCPLFPCSECHGQSECSPGQACLPPGELAGCGTCQPPDVVCQSDLDCLNQSMGPPQICEVPRCGCGERTCLPGCQSDDECAPGQACGADHRCTGRSCTTPGVCPANFICADGFCARQPCMTDQDCGMGSCVNSACYSEPGTCEFLPD